jgi:hypothetical protein
MFVLYVSYEQHNIFKKVFSTFFSQSRGMSESIPKTQLSAHDINRPDQTIFAIYQFLMGDLQVLIKNKMKYKYIESKHNR